MSLRKVNLEAPKIETYQSQIDDKKQQWSTIKCKLVTPMYGGGVCAGMPDGKLPIRATAIRGQLRFWWRLLAQHKWKHSNLCQREFDLWGGIDSGGYGGKASAVFIRVNDVQNSTSPITVPQYLKEINEHEKWSLLWYALFPARPQKDEKDKPILMKPNLTWEIQWLLDENADIFYQKDEKDKKKRAKDENGKYIFLKDKYKEAQEEVIETLRWWATFGGMGARTRRGCGAFEVLSSDEEIIKTPLTAEDVERANCQLSQTQDQDRNDPIEMWRLAVQRLRDFRQGVYVGRNEPSEQAKKEGKPAGRSRWSEPDAIRRLTNQYPQKHRPVHEAGDIFPRGLFGMPIIFHFVGAGEPKDTTLQPSKSNRMTSPIILRPIKVDGVWKASALLLPIDIDKLNQQVQLNGQNVTLWEQDKTRHIKPIRSNGGEEINPLQAFMNYFENPKQEME